MPREGAGAFAGEDVWWGVSGLGREAAAGGGEHCVCVVSVGGGGAGVALVYVYTQCILVRASSLYYYSGEASGLGG